MPNGPPGLDERGSELPPLRIGRGIGSTICAEAVWANRRRAKGRMRSGVETESVHAYFSSVEASRR
jgi:hypothetical protein